MMMMMLKLSLPCYVCSPCLSLEKRTRTQVFWMVLFFLTIGIRIVFNNGGGGELFCTILLVSSTTIAFMYSGSCSYLCWNNNQVSASLIDEEEHDNDPTTTTTNTANEETIVSLFESAATHIETTTTASAAIPPTTAELQLTTTTTAKGRNGNSQRRLFFLDNIKVFLASLVVTHHAACAFGGCGEGSWYLIVPSNTNDNDEPTIFHIVLSTFTLINQSYFMSLFFFISAYFLPQSYSSASSSCSSRSKSKSWHQFRIGKRNRLLFPGLFVFFVVSPMTIILASGVHNNNELGYYPNPGPAWFLFWLLLLNLVYISFVVVTDKEDEDSDSILVQTQEELNNEERDTYTEPLINIDADEDIVTPPPPQGIEREMREGIPTVMTTTTTTPTTLIMKFPSTNLRMAYGLGICGMSLLPFLVLEIGTFASMPIALGSLTTDFFMFYLGLQANQHRWFDNDDDSLIDQLDIHPFSLLACVVLEGTVMSLFGALQFFHNLELVWWAWVLPLVMVGGIFCLDMSLLLLIFFQRYLDFETQVSRFLVKGAYGVYLLHPLIVTGTTMLYIRLFGGGNDDDAGRCGGGGAGEDCHLHYYYPLGFVFVTVVSQLINWPLAYCLAQLPYLNKIL